MSELLQLPEFEELTLPQQASVNHKCIEWLSNTAQVGLLLGGNSSGNKVFVVPNKVYSFGGQNYEPTWLVLNGKGWCIFVESTLFDLLEKELANILNPEPNNIFLPLGLSHGKLLGLLQSH